MRGIINDTTSIYAAIVCCVNCFTLYKICDFYVFYTLLCFVVNSNWRTICSRFAIKFKHYLSQLIPFVVVDVDSLIWILTTFVKVMPDRGIEHFVVRMFFFIIDIDFKCQDMRASLHTIFKKHLLIRAFIYLRMFMQYVLSVFGFNHDSISVFPRIVPIK